MTTRRESLIEKLWYDGEMPRAHAEKLADQVFHLLTDGILILRDGKRIAPEDFYVEPNSP